jgi:hypothetical protein
MIATRILAMIPVVSVAACASPAPAPDNNSLAGSYSIVGTRILANGVGSPREFSIAIVSVTTDRVIFDFTAGDIVRALPARDTATASGTFYFVRWNGNAQFNHELYFRADSCQGNDIGGGGDTVAWAACSIHSTSH